MATHPAGRPARGQLLEATLGPHRARRSSLQNGPTALATASAQRDRADHDPAADGLAARAMAARADGLRRHRRDGRRLVDAEERR